MPAVETLRTAFRMYWDDMDRCRNGNAYWSLLHVTVCLPDICASLEGNNGQTNRARYVAWCELYLPDPLLSGLELYRMRCKVLHQGRASTDQRGRYVGFSFGQPTPSGQVDHRRVDESTGTLNLDVGCLAQEVRDGVGRWIHRLESNPDCAEALNAQCNLQSLVQVRLLAVPLPVAVGSNDFRFVTTSIIKSS